MEKKRTVRIVRGTTPTVYFAFRVVDPADLVTAIFTVSRCGQIIIRKELAEANVETDRISWTLTQAETLQFPLPCSTSEPPAIMMLNWLTADGTRGTSNVLEAWGTPNVINEVIS